MFRIIWRGISGQWPLLLPTAATAVTSGVARLPWRAHSGESRANTVHVAGLRVRRADVERAASFIFDDVRAGSSHVFALVNGQSAMLRRRFSDYAAALEDDRCICLPDGAAVSFGAKWVGLGDIGRAPGPDVFSRCCEQASLNGTRFFLLGGGDGVVERLRASLVERYPGLQIVGVATPPFGEWPDAFSAKLSREIRESGADVLWLGVSAPKQETWGLAHLDQLGLPVVCVGAAFDFLSGTVQRAPVWMRRAGLEWLFRLALEPRRMWRRYLLGNTRFLLDLAQLRDQAHPMHACSPAPPIRVRKTAA